MKNFRLYSIDGLPDNCAPYVIIYTGAQLSGSGAQLSGQGAQLSGPGAQLSAILVCIPTYVISAPLCMYRSLEAPSKISDTIFWVAVMRWSAAFLFRELKKVDFSSMRLSGAWLCGLDFRTLAESVVGIKIDHGVTLEGHIVYHMLYDTLWPGTRINRGRRGTAISGI